MEYRRIIHKILWVVCIASLGGCKFSCSAGGNSPEKLAKDISESLSAQAGSKIAVTCPEINKDGITECTAKMATGGAFIIEVKKTEDGDKFDWKSRGIVFGAQTQAFATKVFKEKLKVTLDTITCPKFSMLQEDGKIACQAKSQKVDINLDVTTSAETLLEVVPKTGLVSSAATSQLVTKAFADQGIQVKADCGPPVRVSVPGSTFTCSAIDANGVAKPVYFKINNADGNINMSSKPF